MPELRVTIREEMNKLLDELVSAGIFNTKAEAIRAATVYFLMDLDWIKKDSDRTYMTARKTKRAR